MTVMILSDAGEADVRPASAGDGALWLMPDDLKQATGWAIRPEGLCRGPVCIPVPPAERQEFVSDDGVNAAAFWRRMGAPTAASDAGDVWVLGEPAEARGDALESLEAPDFALEDADGQTHRLSDYRGKKVFLATWASW